MKEIEELIEVLDACVFASENLAPNDRSQVNTYKSLKQRVEVIKVKHDEAIKEERHRIAKAIDKNHLYDNTNKSVVHADGSDIFNIIYKK